LEFGVVVGLFPVEVRPCEVDDELAVRRMDFEALAGG